MIQIDIQMPERCGVCFAMHTDEIGLESWCGIDETARDLYTDDINTKRPEWCPLKEQEAVEPIPPTDESDLWRCGNCKHQIFRCKHQRFCEMCGRQVKWE